MNNRKAIDIPAPRRASAALVERAARRLLFSLRLERLVLIRSKSRPPRPPAKETSDAAEHWLPGISASLSEGAEVRAWRLRRPDGVDGLPY